MMAPDELPNAAGKTIEKLVVFKDAVQIKLGGHAGAIDIRVIGGEFHARLQAPPMHGTTGPVTVAVGHFPSPGGDPLRGSA